MPAYAADGGDRTAELTQVREEGPERPVMADGRSIAGAYGSGEAIVTTEEDEVGTCGSTPRTSSAAPPRRYNGGDLLIVVIAVANFVIMGWQFVVLRSGVRRGCGWLSARRGSLV